MSTRAMALVILGWLPVVISAGQVAAAGGTASRANSAGPQAVFGSNPQAAQHVAPRPAVVLPSHYVLAVYFHRTHRCPTCRMVGAYVEQAVREGFPAQLQQGTVQFRLVDFEAPRNAAIAAAYQITGPTLVVIDVRNGQVAAWQPMPQLWSLLARRDEFFRYVQGAVRHYLEQQ